MKHDRSVAGDSHHNAGFVLDGEFVETYDVLDYLAERGFNRPEAQAYLRSLPRGAR